MPKVHKEGVPLRPIVSFIGSPTYNLSKHLSKLLSPLVGTSSSAVRNSRDFVNFISTQTIEDDECLVSFDVVSLFTNVPISLAVSVARQRLEADETLDDRTSLSVENIVSLLELCLNATFLAFRAVSIDRLLGQQWALLFQSLWQIWCWRRLNSKLCLH